MAAAAAQSVIVARVECVVSGTRRASVRQKQTVTSRGQVDIISIGSVVEAQETGRSVALTDAGTATTASCTGPPASPADV